MCTVMEELRNEGMQQGIQQGIKEGIKQGNKQGMQKFAELTKQLLALGRTNDLSRATEDEAYRDQLIKELAIQQAYPLNSPQGEFFYLALSAIAWHAP